MEIDFWKSVVMPLQSGLVAEVSFDLTFGSVKTPNKALLGALSTDYCYSKQLL